MPDSDLLAERDDRGVLTLTLNRPDARNALNLPLVEALTAALADAEADDAVRCVLLTGTPPAFCAGGDLRAMLERRGDPLATQRWQRDYFTRLATKLLTMEKPLVAKVNGDAIGAGMILAATADFAIATEEARVGATFPRVGLIPDLGGTWLLPRLVGLRRAREIVLSTALYPAADAVEWGLFTEAVPAGELEKRVDAIVARIARGPTRTFGLARRALAEATAMSLDQALQREAAVQGLCFSLEDHAEGVDAFLEKRKPQYTGR